MKVVSCVGDECFTVRLPRFHASKNSEDDKQCKSADKGRDNVGETCRPGGHESEEGEAGENEIVFEHCFPFVLGFYCTLVGFGNQIVDKGTTKKGYWFMRLEGLK